MPRNFGLHHPETRPRYAGLVVDALAGLLIAAVIGGILWIT